MLRAGDLGATRLQERLERLLGFRGTEDDRAVTWRELRRVFPTLYALSPAQSANSQGVADLFARIGDAESDIDTLQADLATLQDTVTGVQADIATLGLRQVASAQVAAPAEPTASYADMVTLDVTPGATGNPLLIIARFELTYAPGDTQTFDARITRNDTELVLDSYEGDHAGTTKVLSIQTDAVAGANTLALEARSPHAGQAIANAQITCMEFNP